MMGAHMIRMKRMQRGESFAPPLGTEGQSVLTERCNLLFVASGVFFIVGTVVMIPGFFGDTNFFIYSASSFGIGVVILVFACFCHSIIEKDGSSGQRMPVSTAHRDTMNTTESPIGITESPTATRILDVSVIQPDV